MVFGRPKVMWWLGLVLGVLRFEYVYLALISPSLGMWYKASSGKASLDIFFCD